MKNEAKDKIAAESKKRFEERTAREKSANEEIAQYEKEFAQRQAVERIQIIMQDFQNTLDTLQQELDSRKRSVDKIIEQGEFEKKDFTNRGMVGTIGGLMWQWNQRSNQYRADLAVEYAANYDNAFYVGK